MLFSQFASIASKGFLSIQQTGLPKKRARKIGSRSQFRCRSDHGNNR